MRILLTSNIVIESINIVKMSSMEVNQQIAPGHKLKSLTAGKTLDGILIRDVVNMDHVYRIRGIFGGDFTLANHINIAKLKHHLGC